MRPRLTPPTYEGSRLSHERVNEPRRAVSFRDTSPGQVDVTRCIT